MKEYPLVSIIIPCYNGEAFVADAIQSALDQTYSHKEIIVIDDGSADGSLDIIRSFGDAIQWEAGPNRGGSAARNRGGEVARGEWLQFLDADDRLKPEKIQHQITLTEEHPEVDLVAAAYNKHHLDGQIEIVHPNSGDPWIGLITTSLGHTSANLWRRQAVVAAGGWDERLRSSQEYSLLFNMLQKDARVAFDHEALVDVMVTPGSISNSNMLGNLERYIALRRAIRSKLDELGLLTSERREVIDAVIFGKIRLLAARDIDLARCRYEEAFPDGYYPQPSSINRSLYCALFKVLGLTGTERLMRVWRQIKAVGVRG